MKTIIGALGLVLWLCALVHGQAPLLDPDASPSSQSLADAAVQSRADSPNASSEVRSPDSTAKALGSLKPDNVVFSLFDVIVYLLVLVLCGAILRAVLRALAPEEVSDGWGGYWAAAFLTLAVWGVFSSQSFFPIPVILTLLLVAAISVILIMWLCWAPWLNAMIGVVVFLASVAACGYGAGRAMDRILPDDRMTLARRVRISLGLMDRFADREGEAVFTKDTLRVIKAGLKLESRAMVSAVSLLKDPAALSRMVASHQEDLDALGLIVAGETNTAEQLAEMGIVYAPDDPARRGIDVLQHANQKAGFTDQDVEDVAMFLKSVRKDGSEVTASDVAIVVRDAMARAKAIEVGGMDDLQPNGLAGAETDSVGPSAEPVANDPATSTAVATGALAATQAPALSAAPIDRLSATERAAWLDSKTGIVVRATMSRGGNFLLQVNGHFVKPGESVYVERASRVFEWRLVSATLQSAEWEPVLENAGQEVFVRF